MSDYIVDFRGRPACPCLAEWLPVFESELVRRGVIRESLDIAQLIGGAAASGGTHASGGAFDIWQTDDVTELVGREMGAATFNRVTGSFATNRHTHGVLNGCPHNGPARYQIDALAAGFNGLGSGGRGAPDDGVGPRQLRTWREGIAWAKKLQEDDMATPESIAQIVDALRPVIAEAVAGNKVDVGKPAKWSDDNALATLIAQGEANRKLLVEINKRLASLNAKG